VPINPLSYLDFKREMAFDLHWGDLDKLSQKDKDTLHRLIQSAIRTVFLPLRPGTSRVHNWSWADPLRTLIVNSKATGTLAGIPSRSGELIVFAAQTAVFNSDHVGHDLTLDSSGQRYTIVEFVRASVVKVIGSPRSKFGQTTQLGDRRNATTTSVVSDVTTTKITESSTKAFDADMVGDSAVFAGGSSYLIERVDTDNNFVIVQGDASAETGALTIQRRVTAGVSVGSAGGFFNIAGNNAFRQDMEDDSDTIVFVGDATVYTITEFLGVSSVRVDADPTGETITSGFDIKKSFSTDYTVAADTAETTITVEEDDAFVAEDVGQFLTFIGPLLNSYEILEVIDDRRVRVAGNAAAETTTEVSIVRAAAALDTTARTFDGAATLLTADAAVFTSSMVGLAIEFPLPLGSSRKYAITEFVGTTSVKVAGNASSEGPPHQKFLVVGATDLAADDAFTVLNTGGDYEFPVDFGGIDGPITFSADTVATEVMITTEANIRRARQALTGDGRPQMAAIRAQIHDGKATGRYDLLLYPGNPDGKYTFEYRQIVILPDVDEENPFPPGGAAYSELYLAACLSLADERINDRRGLRWNTFQERLAAMIEIDTVATGAEHLGRGFEDGSATGLRVIPKTLSVTYVPGA